MTDLEWRQATDQRLSNIETRLHKVETSDAVGDERYKQQTHRLDRIDASLNKLMWIVITSVIGAAMTMILNGNLPGV